MKTILTWVLSSWQGSISLVWDIQHSKELPLKLLNRLESLDPLCGPRYGEGLQQDQSRVLSHISGVFLKCDDDMFLCLHLAMS